MLGDSHPENVVLLEIEPAKQKTRVDFACTESLLLGIRPVFAHRYYKTWRQLFINARGREVQIERIYNRVIFDELLRRPDLKLPFRFQEELDVVWVGHPNWYFPDQQTFVAIPEKRAYHAGIFLPTNFRLPNRPATSS